MLSQFEKACFVRAAAAAELTCCRVGFAHEEQVEVHPEERRDDPQRQGPCVQHRNRRVFLVKPLGNETMRAHELYKVTGAAMCAHRRRRKRKSALAVCWTSFVES